MAKAKSKTVKRKPRRKSRKNNSGCALTALFSVMIIIMIVLIGVVGYLYLKESNWFQIRDKNRQQKTKPVKKDTQQKKSFDFITYQPPEKENNNTSQIQKQTPEPKPQTVSAKKPAKPAVKPKPKPAAKPASKPVQKPKIKKKPAPKPKPAAKKPKPKALTKSVKIYLTKYNAAEDKMRLTAVTRTIKNTDSPLRASLLKLLNGPTDSEDNAGYTSSIPGGVRILSLSIKNGIAYIDLNKQFEFGTGTKLMRTRVYQVVYTATQFSTVNKVQILIEGRKKTNFAGEGLDISHPLGRLSSAQF